MDNTDKAATIGAKDVIKVVKTNCGKEIAKVLVFGGEESVPKKLLSFSEDLYKLNRMYFKYRDADILFSVPNIYNPSIVGSVLLYKKNVLIVDHVEYPDIHTVTMRVKGRIGNDESLRMTFVHNGNKWESIEVEECE